MAKKFIPDWTEKAPELDSYRAIFKWGDPNTFKNPNPKLYEELKQIFNLDDNYFKTKKYEGRQKVQYKKPFKLSKKQIQDIASIVGYENISTREFDRLRFATGKTLEEAMKLRQGIIERVADCVVHPGNVDDVQKIVSYCNKHKIPLYVYGGGSSVNFGLRPAKGGITLVLSTHMNRILSVNEINQTVTVQAGILGPTLEETLNNAKKRFGTQYNYTCGHFPQSFEYSSVGGWIVTLGSGQSSSYYGDADDLVISMKWVTPAGTFTTKDYAATATGPKVNDIMKGCEGTFGVLVEVTWKIYRYMPENRKRFGFIFKTFEDAVNASREISQGEFGMPAVFRVSDEEETHIGLKLYGIDGTLLDTFMQLKGYKPMQRCLFIGSAEGERHFTNNIKKQVKKICKKYGGMYITGLPTRLWESGRYKDPYIREDLNDYGILIDTLETSVKWDNLHHVHKAVRQFIKNRPRTVCMTHASHFYPQGTNLYFIYIMKTDDIQEYIQFQDGIIDTIAKSGGSLSHHHGVGRMIAPWMEEHIGKEQMAVLRAIKKHFDPNNIMNPGGQLGLDLKNKNWRSIK